MRFLSKVIRMEDLSRFRAGYDDRLLSKPHRSVVATNGCFDVVHAGHVRSLAAARALGDALIVGLNGDDSVRQLKGAGRPVNTALDRATLLAAFEFVDAVCIFPGIRATEFLRQARPDVYVKSADYTFATLDPGERQALEEVGADIRFLPLVPGLSTTVILSKLAGLQA